MSAPASTTGEPAKPKKKLSRTWKVIIILAVAAVSIAVLVPIGIIAYVYITIGIEEKHLVKMADAGFAKAKQTIDPKQLRDWAMKEVSQHATSYETNGEWQISESEYPGNLRDLYAEPIEDASVYKQGRETYVQIYWGGGFFHWMLFIGDTNFVAVNDSEVQTAEWVPGIYYGREDTVHPIK